MKNAPIIDLSLRPARQLIAEKGVAWGLALVLWYRLARPAAVGSMWAGLCVYTWRYLIPSNQAELPLEQLLRYLTAIGAIAAALVAWMIASRVAHPFASRSRMQRLLRRTAGFTVEPSPLPVEVEEGRGSMSRIFVASHDANGLIAALRILSVPTHAGIDDFEPVPPSSLPRGTVRLATTSPRPASRPSR